MTKRAATAVVCLVGAAGISGCVTTLPGAAGHAPGSALPASPDTSTANGIAESLQEQCSIALASAKGFLDSWKKLATNGVPPTAEQRNALAGEVNGYIDQLNAQLPAINDQGLVSHVQSIVGEMNTIVLGLQSGIAVELSAYSAAVNATTEYCK